MDKLTDYRSTAASEPRRRCRQLLPHPEASLGNARRAPRNPGTLIVNAHRHRAAAATAGSSLSRSKPARRLHLDFR